MRDQSMSFGFLFLVFLTSCTPEILGERPSQRAARLRAEESKSVALDLRFVEGVLTHEIEIHPTWTPPSSALVESTRVVFYQDDHCGVTLDQDLIPDFAASSASFSPLSEGAYSFAIYTTLSNGKIFTSECSLPIQIDRTPPAAPSSLGFLEGPLTRANTVTASWAPSLSTDVASSSIQVFSDALCLSPLGPAQSLSPSAISLSLPSLSSGARSYQLTLTDSAQNSVTSSCSTSVVIDHVNPSLASAHFSETTISNQSPFHLIYGPIEDAYHSYCILKNQTDLSACVFVDGVLPETYSPDSQGAFKLSIYLKDSAGNLSERVDTNEVVFDSIAPSAPTLLSFVEGSTSNASLVTARWTPSLSLDVQSAELQVYRDGTCTTEDGPAIAVNPSDSSAPLTFSDGSTHSYKIRLSDAAQNQTLSDCSTEILIDSLAPTAPTGLGFSETTPTQNLNVTARWTPSTSPALVSSTLQWYSDAGCVSTAGPAIDLLLNDSQKSVSFSDGETRAFKVTVHTATKSATSACSSAITIDRTAPVAPIGLTFSEGTLSNQSSVTATWTPSSSTDVASQSFQAYSDTSCSTSTGSAQVLSASATTAILSALTDGDVRAYKLTVTDAAGNASTSACSSSITIDRTAPSAPTALTFSEGALSKNASVTATWTPSSSTDVASVSFQLYSDSACSVTSGAASSILPSDTTKSIPVNNGELLSYKISVSDAAGNSSTSTCSSSITIDRTAPSAPTALTFSEGSLSKNASVTATWTPSSSTDVASVSFQLYSDSGCGVASGTASSIATSATTKSISVSDGQILSYKISVTDAAGNASTSACSSSITIDRAAPAAPTALTFSEGSLSKNASVTATWTPSSSTDVASQSFQAYSDANCSTLSGSAQVLSASATTAILSALTDGDVRAYKLTVTDAAGNSSTSTCSSAITIDQSIFPTQATLIGSLGPDPEASDSGDLTSFYWDLDFSQGISNPSDLLASDFINDCDPRVDTCATDVSFQLQDLGDADHRYQKLSVTGSSMGMIRPAHRSIGSLISMNGGTYQQTKPPAIHYSGRLTIDINAHTFTCHCQDPQAFGLPDWQFGNQTSTGEPNAPFEICTKDQLRHLADLVSSTQVISSNRSFYQCNDLDLKDFEMLPIGNSQTPFQGTYHGNGYKISHLTLNHSDLVYAYELTTQQSSQKEVPSSETIGLFGQTQGATLKNIQLVEARIGGSIAVGALVGKSDQTAIIGCQVTNSLVGANQFGGLLAGVANEGEITKSSASGKVYGFGHAMGGLLGVGNHIELRSLAFTGSVYSEEVAGGLVGALESGLIEESVAFGSEVRSKWIPGSEKPMYPSNSAGGLVGVFSAQVDNAYLRNSASYLESIQSIGNESARAGGIIGNTESLSWDLKMDHLISSPLSIRAESSSENAMTHPILPNLDEIRYAPEQLVVNTLGDAPTTFRPEWVNLSPGGGPPSTWVWEETTEAIRDLKKLESDHGFNDSSEKVWTVQASGAQLPIPFGVTVLEAPTASVDSLHPYFCSCDASLRGFPFGNPHSEGTAAKPYEICSVHQWLDFKEGVRAPNATSGLYFTQCRDLDLKDVTDGSPLVGDEGSKFSGTFDGNGFVISNLLVSRSAADNGAIDGLFRRTDGATLRRIALYHPTLIGSSSQEGFIGALIGYGTTTTIDSCHVVGAALSKGQAVGGFVGLGKGLTILNSSASGSIQGTHHVGGLVGNLDGQYYPNSIEKCAFLEGTIIGESTTVEGNSVGGLIGRSSGSLSLSQSVVYGEGIRSSLLNGESNVGGLIGYQAGGPISISDSSVLNGIIEARAPVSHAAGLIGWFRYDELQGAAGILHLNHLISAPRSVRALLSDGAAAGEGLQLSHPLVSNLETLIAQGGYDVLAKPGAWLEGKTLHNNPTDYSPPLGGNVLYSISLQKYSEISDPSSLTAQGFDFDHIWSLLETDDPLPIPTYAPTLASVALTVDAANPTATPVPTPPPPTYPAVCSCEPNHASTRSGNSPLDPYEICSQSDFENFRLSSKTNSFSGKFITQCTDLSLTGYGVNDFIGSSSVHFSGTFTGTGYQFTGMNITVTDNQDLAGLFLAIENATLNGITLVSPVLSTSTNGQWGHGYAALVGYAVNSIINDCKVNYANIELAGYRPVGGLVGESAGNNISGSKVDGSVRGYTAGGLIGLANGGGFIMRSGFIKGAVRGQFVSGGLIGQSDTPNSLYIDHCLVMAEQIRSVSTSGGAIVGGLIGSVSASRPFIQGTAVHVGHLMAQTEPNGLGYETLAGGFFGQISSGIGIDLYHVQASFQTVTVSGANPIAHPLTPYFGTLPSSLRLITGYNQIAWPLYFAFHEGFDLVSITQIQDENYFLSRGFHNYYWRWQPQVNGGFRPVPDGAFDPTGPF